MRHAPAPEGPIEREMRLRFAKDRFQGNPTGRLSPRAVACSPADNHAMTKHLRDTGYLELHCMDAQLDRVLEGPMRGLTHRALLPLDPRDRNPGTMCYESTMRFDLPKQHACDGEVGCSQMTLMSSWRLAVSCSHSHFRLTFLSAFCVSLSCARTVDLNISVRCSHS